MKLFLRGTFTYLYNDSFEYKQAVHSLIGLIVKKVDGMTGEEKAETGKMLYRLWRLQQLDSLCG